MERKKNSNIENKADFILVGDFHIMENQPVCRLDDIQETQWRKIKFISDLQVQHDCPIIHAGDLYDFWKPSPRLLSESILKLPKKLWTVVGNHDTPQHNLDLLHKSGVYTLSVAGALQILNTCHWLETPEECSWRGFINEETERKILVWHVMNYQGAAPWPGCTDYKASAILRKYTEYDLIVTGHNHLPFVEQLDGRLLVNPGSLLRTTTSQINHRPRVYLYYLQTNTVVPVYIPIENDVISREHLEITEQRDSRIEAFVTSLNDWEVKASFEDNLERFFQTNRVRPAVQDIIYKSMEYDETDKKT